MATKPGFMMYHSKARVLAKMGAESFMAVMLAMCDYSEFGAEPTALNDMEIMAFDMMRDTLDRDDERYQKRVDAGRKGGIASGEARRTIAKQNEAKRTIAKQNEANEPTQPNVNPTSTQHQPNPTSSLSLREGEDGERDIPSVEEVKEYARLAGLVIDAEAFVTINRARGWVDCLNNPIRDWRTWLLRSPLLGKEAVQSAEDDQPDMAGQRDEYGGRFI